MRRTKALRDSLEALTRVYNDGERVDVKFDDPPRASPDGHVFVSPNVRDTYGRDVSGAQELRIIADTLSHEVEHIRESDLTSKQDFTEEYPERPQFAGNVINILEDQYVDYQRTQRFPGLRKACAFKTEAIMANHHRRPKVDGIENRGKQVQETLLQVAFAGYAKGISDADDDLREFAGRVRPIIRDIRREHDQQTRKDMAHAVMDIADDYLPESEDVDLPDECVICGERPPTMIIPFMGPVCDQCAPTGHGGGGEHGDGERGDDADIEIHVVPAPDDAESGDGGGNPLDGDGDDDAAGDDADGDGDAADGSEQAPVSGGGDRDIDPRDWEWLDLGDHEDHDVAIVDDDAGY